MELLRCIPSSLNCSSKAVIVKDQIPLVIFAQFLTI
jgi:hypothetical protein